MFGTGMVNWHCSDRMAGGETEWRGCAGEGKVCAGRATVNVALLEIEPESVPDR